MEIGRNKLNRRFTLYFVAYFIAHIVLFGFWPAILRGFGYNDTFIGIASSVSTFSGMVLKLAISYWFDKRAMPARW